MSDKFRKVYPLKITFGSAEQPTSPKLTAISEQTRNGLGLIEQAIGDPWNQSGDDILTSFPLFIPNLARMIGQNEYLNPVIYPMDDDFIFTEDIGDAHQGFNEFHLTYKPKDTTSGLISVGGGGNISGD